MGFYLSFKFNESTNSPGMTFHCENDIFFQSLLDFGFCDGQ